LFGHQSKLGLVCILGLGMVGLTDAETQPSETQSSETQPGAVMVSEAELKALGALPPKREAPQSPHKKEEWRLDGIIFKAPEEWVIWLNGEQFAPDHLPVGIRILEVCPQSIQLCRDEAEAPATTLCLNQSVNLNRCVPAS
jgi:hypothetical protein